MGAFAIGNRKFCAVAAILVAAFLLGALGAPPAEAGKSKCRAKNALPESVSTAKAERTVLCLLNKRRAKRGLPKLARQSALDHAAREHSSYMVSTGCFAHQCPGEASLLKRLVDAGYLGLGSLLGWGYGENIAWGSDDLGTPRMIVRAWMKSPGHRENILDRTFEQIGVGLVWGSRADSSLPAATYTTDFGYRDR